MLKRVGRAEAVGNGEARGNGYVVRVEERPGAREPRVLVTLHRPHPRHHVSEVLVGVREGGPPGAVDDALGLELADRPERRALLVEVDGLVDPRLALFAVSLEGGLVGCQLEAHLEDLGLLLIGGDEVDGAPVDLVVLAHVLLVRVRHCEIVEVLDAREHATLPKRALPPPPTRRLALWARGAGTWCGHVVRLGVHACRCRCTCTCARVTW